jgi:hypothetical protein
MELGRHGIQAMLTLRVALGLSSYSVCLKPLIPMNGGVISVSHVIRGFSLRNMTIQFNEMIRTGEASDTIELARRGHVTQPRMSQIMALNQLAPDIQEALLNLPATKGKPEIHEKRLRPIAAMLYWEDQRASWSEFAEMLQ